MNALHHLIERSRDLDDVLIASLPEYSYDDSDRIQAVRVSCNVAWEHGLAVRFLIEHGLTTTGIAAMRMQFETLTRAVWLLYAATDDHVALVRSFLSVDSEQAARKLPSASEMLRALSGKAPDGAIEMLASFKRVTWDALNSYVHGGLHPLKRQGEGYPLPLLIQIVKSSNGLSTMTAMMLAILSGDGRFGKLVAATQRTFADCLPDLIEIAATKRETST